MPVSRRLAAAILLIFAILPLGGKAADLDSIDAIPEPPEAPLQERGIWGAIAYSPADDRYGFFWGADKRQEARDIALKHCENAKGKSCEVVNVFRNHRHWTDDDKTGFPYEHCAALSTGKHSESSMTFWGAASDTTRKAAETKALSLCGGDQKDCKIREWVCT